MKGNDKILFKLTAGGLFPFTSVFLNALFLIFVNDLPSAIQVTKADIYVYDTTIGYSTDYKEAPLTVCDGLQSDLDRLQTWSDNNKMILYGTKTLEHAT